MSVLRALDEVVAALVDRGISYALIGGLSAMSWGRPRTTLDVDLVLDADAERVRSTFARLGYREGQCVGPSEMPDYTQFWSPSGTRVDVFFARTDFERVALASAVDAHIGTSIARTVTAESSVVYKLIAHRGRDLDDIEAIMVARGSILDWTFIERYSVEWDLEPWLAPFRARFKPAA